MLKTTTNMKMANEILAKRLEILQELGRLCLEDMVLNPNDADATRTFEGLYNEVENLCKKFKITE